MWSGYQYNTEPDTVVLSPLLARCPESWSGGAAAPLPPPPPRLVTCRPAQPGLGWAGPVVLEKVPSEGS